MARHPTLTLLTCLLSLAAAHASPRDAHAAEVGYDIREKQFSGRIPHGEEFQITLTVKPGSTATIQYWPYYKRGVGSTTCDANATPPETATSFAARSVEVEDGNAKLAFDMPRLYPNQDYCFRINASLVRPLDDAEKSRIATALQKSLEDLVAGDLAPADFTRECAAKLTKPGTVPQCVLVELFTRHLTLDLQVQRTDSPNAGKRGLPDVLKDALNDDRQLLEDLNTLYARNLGHRDFQTGLDNLRRKLTALTGLYGRFDLDKPLYEPPAEKTAKKTVRKAPEKPPAEPARPELPKITAPKDALDRLVKLAALDHTKDFGVAEAEFKLAFKSVLDLVPCGQRDVIPTQQYAAPAAIDAKKLDAIDGLWANSCDAVDQLAALHAIKPENRIAMSVASVTVSDGFIRMFSAVQSVTVDQGPAVKATSAGARDKAFPFYASVDIGLAPIVFSRSTINIAQYFAINLYFTAVDPDEPLYRLKSGRSHGYGFLRRFSISAGITTTGRQIENAGSVTGLIGSQLPLLGLGFRVLRMVRVSGGIALYNQKDPNPVVDRHNLGVAPYIALSLDVALFKWASGLVQ